MKGEYILNRLKALQKEYPEHLVAVHGKGLLIGMDFASEELGYRVAAGLFRRGVLVAGTLISSQTIRVEPALNIPNELIDRGLDRLADALKEAVSRD